MKKIKVAFCIPNMIIGGCESVFIRTLTEVLKDDSLELVVVTHSPIREKLYADWFTAHPQITMYTYYPFGNLFEEIGRRFRFFPVKHLRKIIYNWYKKTRLLRMCASKKLGDVDVFVDYKNLDFLKELSYFNKPKITWIHGSIDFFNQCIRVEDVKNYDKLIAITDSFVNDFQQLYPEYSDKIVRVYNPINVEEIRALANKATVPQNPYFCSVSRLDGAEKDIKTLLCAFDKFWLDNNCPDVNLVVVGDGPEKLRLKKITAELQSRSKIVFTGSLDNPFGYMRGALAHILSSRNEGFAAVLTEAASLDVLNISSDCKSGPPEVLMNGKAGLMFKVGDVDKLAEIMSDVWNNKVDSAPFIAAGKDGLKRFDGTVIADQIIKLVKSLC